MRANDVRPRGSNAIMAPMKARPARIYTYVRLCVRASFDVSSSSVCMYVCAVYALCLARISSAPFFSPTARVLLFKLLLIRACSVEFISIL